MRYVFIILVLLSFGHAKASEWVLFSDGEQVPNYNQVVGQIKANDTLILNSQKFQVQKILGNGRTTLVFDIGNEKALRIPLRTGFFRPDIEYHEFIQAFYRGAHLLKNAGLRTVEIDEELSQPPHFLVVEKIQTKFDLRTFLQSLRALNPEEKIRAHQSLLEFAVKAAAFARIGDFDATQLHWTGDEWILIDFTANTWKAKSTFDATVFSHMDLIPRELRTLLVNTVYNERLKGQSASGPSCAQAHR